MGTLTIDDSNILEGVNAPYAHLLVDQNNLPNIPPAQIGNLHITPLGDASPTAGCTGSPNTGCLTQIMFNGTTGVAPLIIGGHVPSLDGLSLMPSFIANDGLDLGALDPMLFTLAPDPTADLDLPLLAGGPGLVENHQRVHVDQDAGSLGDPANYVGIFYPFEIDFPEGFIADFDCTCGAVGVGSLPKCNSICENVKLLGLPIDGDATGFDRCIGLDVRVHINRILFYVGLVPDPGATPAGPGATASWT